MNTSKMSINQSYKRIKSEADTTKLEQNEIRVAKGTRIGSAISYAVNCLSDEPAEEIQKHQHSQPSEGDQQEKQEKKESQPHPKFDTIKIRSMGTTIDKAVLIAELIKRRCTTFEIHQNTELFSQKITDVFSGLEEGLESIVQVRLVPSIVITISKKPLDPNEPGYQLHTPKPKEEQDASDNANIMNNVIDPHVGRMGGFRGRSRGGRGGDRGGFRGRGRGRGSFRGRGNPRGSRLRQFTTMNEENNEKKEDESPQQEEKNE